MCCVRWFFAILFLFGVNLLPHAEGPISISDHAMNFSYESNKDGSDSLVLQIGHDKFHNYISHFQTPVAVKFFSSNIIPLFLDIHDEFKVAAEEFDGKMKFLSMDVVYGNNISIAKALSVILSQGVLALDQNASQQYMMILDFAKRIGSLDKSKQKTAFVLFFNKGNLLKVAELKKGLLARSANEFLDSIVHVPEVTSPVINHPIKHKESAWRRFKRWLRPSRYAKSGT